MTLISIGKLRGLQQCCSARGTFTCLALDHRQNLRKANPLFMLDEELSRFKLDVVTELADLSSAVLLDPEVSAAQSISANALPGWIGLVVAVESTGYGGTPTARQSQVLPGWSIAKAKFMGASMVKLLVYYHPESSSAPEIESFVKYIADECRNYDLSLMLEPLSYSLDASRTLTSDEKQYVVTETARRLVFPGVDILKAEFPLDITEVPDEASWVTACEKISAASQAPWIVLSAAVEFNIYLRQVEIACRAGASGCAVGRAVWQEAVILQGEARRTFLQKTGRERLAKLYEISSNHGRSIEDFYSADAPFDWYKSYQRTSH